MAKRPTRYLNGFGEMKKYFEDVGTAQAKVNAGGTIDPNIHFGFKTPHQGGESYDEWVQRELIMDAGDLKRPPAVPLPAWAPQAPSQPASQAPSQPARTPYAPTQLPLGAPMGQVSPARVTNQALSNALRAPPAPQAVGGNNG